MLIKIQPDATVCRYLFTAKSLYILKNINSKLENENAMVAKADKGKTCVIIYTHESVPICEYFIN